MKKRKQELQLNTYVDIIKRYLISKGIKYVEGQKIYYFQVGNQTCCLSIMGRKIKIENNTTKKVDIYDLKPASDAVLIHSRFRGGDYEELDLTQSEVYFQNDKLFISTCGAKIETPVTENKCSNKLLFLSDMLMGETIYDTLDNIEALDGSKPITISHDIPRVTTEKLALSTLLHNESKIYLEICESRTR